MKDRIQTAWELRAAIHRHVVTHPRCTIEDIWAALPDANRHTVRRATQKMRTDGDIEMVSNKANVGRYLALNSSIRPVNAVREKLASGGRATQPNATAASKRKARERNAGNEKPAPSGRYLEGERNRQQLLDFLNANPWSSSVDCARHIASSRGESTIGKGAHCIASQRLNRMAAFGEVEKRRRSDYGNGQTWEWRALVASTLSAEECAARVYLPASEANSSRACRSSVTVTSGAKTTHRGTERDRPLPGGSGQGCLRARHSISFNQLY